MTMVTFSKKQIKALQQDFQSCIDCSMVDGQFNAFAFHGAVSTALQLLIDDGHIFMVTFSKKQIKALQQDFQSCIDCSMVDGQFNAFAFHGAVSTALQLLIDDGHIFFDESKYLEEAYCEN